MRKHILTVLAALACSSAAFGQNFDARLMEAINSDRDRHLDPLFRDVTNSVSPMTFIAPASFITYAFMKRDSVSKANAIYVASTLVMNGILTETLKKAVNRTRPFVHYSWVEKETKGGGGSFPSGHTSAAFSIATSVSILYPKWYVIVPSYLWAGTVGYSRVDLGVHYPSDVLAGAVVGAGSAWLSYKLTRWISGRQYKKRQRLLHVR